MSANTLAAPASTTHAETEAIPEPVIETQQKFAEQFAEHIAIVREQGDVLDARHSLRPWRIGKIALASSAISGLLVGSGHPPGMAAGTGAMVACAAGTWASLRTEVDQERAYLRSSDRPGAVVGAKYDVYRYRYGRDRKIAVHWPGPDTTEQGTPDAAEQLEIMARLAQDNDVSQLVVNKGRLANAISGLEGVGRTMTSRRWLGDNKELLVGGIARKEVWQVASPGDWIKAVQEIRSEQGMHTIKSLINMLGERQPEHPLVQLHREYARDPITLHARLSSRLRGLFGRELSETTVAVSGRWENFGRQRQHREAHVDGMNVRYTVNGLYDGTVALLERALGFRPEDLTQILSNAGNDSRTTRALELSVYKILQNQSAALPAAAGERARFQCVGHLNFSTPQDVLGLGRPDSHGIKYSLLEQRLIKACVFSMAVAIGGLTTLIGTARADTAYADLWAQARERIAAEQGLDPETANVDNNLIRDRVNSASPVNGPWGWWRQARADYSGIFKSSRDNNHSGQKNNNWSFRGNSGVGNVSDDADTVEWTLSPHGMETAGYWAEATSGNLQGNKQDNHGKPIEPMTIEWRLDYWQRQEPAVEYPTTLDEHSYKQWVEVQRVLTPGDTLHIENAGNFTPLPVLAGAKIAAISVDGKAVPVMAAKDGTFAIKLPASSQPLHGKVKYWIVPDSKAKPHAIGPTVVSGDLGYNSSALTSNWIKVIPNFERMTPIERRRALISYLGTRLRYSRQPLSEDDLRAITAWSDFVNLTLNSGKANCNTSNTILNIAEPGLNAATGHANSAGAGEHVLTSREAHMWSVDSEGTIWDATPQQAASTGQGTANQSNQEPIPLLPWVAITGLGLAGITIATQRQTVAAGVRRGGAAINNSRAERARSELAATHPSAIRFAVAAAEQALYARNMSVRTASIRAASASFTDEDALIKINRPDIHSKDAERILRRQHGIPSGVAKTLRTARRAQSGAKTSKSTKK